MTSVSWSSSSRPFEASSAESASRAAMTAGSDSPLVRAAWRAASAAVAAAVAQAAKEVAPSSSRLAASKSVEASAQRQFGRLFGRTLWSIASLSAAFSASSFSRRGIGGVGRECFEQSGIGVVAFRLGQRLSRAGTIEDRLSGFLGGLAPMSIWLSHHRPKRLHVSPFAVVAERAISRRRGHILGCCSRSRQRVALCAMMSAVSVARSAEPANFRAAMIAAGLFNRLIDDQVRDDPRISVSDTVNVSVDVARRQNRRIIVRI